MIIIFSCDAVQKSAQKTINIFYNFYIYCKSDVIREALLEMMKSLEIYGPTFTAAHFYDLNRKTIINFFFELTIYFIVILQFNNN